MNPLPAHPEASWRHALEWGWTPSFGWGVALAAAAAVVVIQYYRSTARRTTRAVAGRLALCRMLSLAALAWLACEPQWASRRVASPWIAVLIDASRSMQTDDVAGSTRSSAALQTLAASDAALLPQLVQRFQVRYAAFAADLGTLAEPVAADAASLRTELERACAARDDAFTRAGDALADVVAGEEGALPAAVVLVTDGAATAGASLDEAARQARDAGVPIYACAIGSADPPHVAIADVLLDEVVAVGDRFLVGVVLRVSGAPLGPARMTLIDLDRQTTLAAEQCELPGKAGQAFVSLIAACTEPGRRRLEVRIEPVQAAANWRAAVADARLDVRSEPVRVLLAEGEPTYEFRALKSLLQRDPALQLRVWLQDADSGYREVEALALGAFPAAEADLDAYDALILGAIDWRQIPRGAQDALVDWVDRGGGLAVVAGPAFADRSDVRGAPWATLLPAAWEASPVARASREATRCGQVLPTPLGRAAPLLRLVADPQQNEALWHSFPPVDGVPARVQPKRGAETLAAVVTEDAPAERSSPVILRHYFGAGEVLLHLTDATWRWRFRNDDRYFASYWGQAVRQLARGRRDRGLTTLTADRSRYRAGEPVRLRWRGRDAATALPEAAPQVEVIDAAGAPRLATLVRRDDFPTLFEATLWGLPPERYAARLLGAVNAAPAEFVVEAVPPETAPAPADVEALQRAAQLTGGVCLPWREAGRLVASLPAPQPIVLDQRRPVPLVSPHWALAVLGGTLGYEWYLRRRLAFW